MLAPLLADAGKKIDPSLPYIIFSTVCFVTGFLCLLLPETNHIALPNTIQEAVDMEKYECKMLPLINTNYYKFVFFFYF